MREFKFRAWDKFQNIMYYNTSEIIFAEYSDEEIMQYTGLKDKNGKEIYEGDIVKSVVSKVMCVVNIGHYNDPISSQHDIIGVWLEIINHKDTKHGFDKCVLTKKKTVVIEVIGNIYENPELMKNE